MKKGSPGERLPFDFEPDTNSSHADHQSLRSRCIRPGILHRLRRMVYSPGPGCNHRWIRQWMGREQHCRLDTLSPKHQSAGRRGQQLRGWCDHEFVGRLHLRRIRDSRGGDVVTGIQVRVKHRSNHTHTVQLKKSGSVVGETRTLPIFFEGTSNCANTGVPSTEQTTFGEEQP